jgi:filamentous haemagglutinin family N-terminal domain
MWAYMRIFISFILAFCLFDVTASFVNALPEGEQVENGSASFERPNNMTLNITVNNGTVINFNSFNIAHNEVVNFNPYDPASAAFTNVLSRVSGPNPSYIAGTLNANLNLYLVNTNGIHFSPTAQINVNNLVASTLDISTNNFIQGNYEFEQNMKYSQILNEGVITANNNVALLASAVNNASTGIIVARAGTVSLASGDKVTVSFDMRGLMNVEVNEKTTGKVLDMQGNTVKDAVANAGKIEATQVLMSAKTANDIFENAVNQTGIVRATGIVNKNGVIRVISNKKIQISGELSSSSLREASTPKAAGDEAISPKVVVSSEDFVGVSAELMTAGDTQISSNGDIAVDADITTDSGDLELIADADLDGIGAFKQAKGTFITTVGHGDITIQSSGEGTLANIASAGDLILRKGGAPAVFTQWSDSKITAAGSMRIGEDVTINANNTLYEIGKDWRNYGNFIPEMSTVSLVSDQEAFVLGNNKFNNFSVTAPGKIVRFDTESTTVISGTLTLKGAYGRLLVLGSIEPPKQWKILPQGDTDIAYVLIGDCINIRGPPVKIIHSSSLGNNSNLDLDPYWTGQGVTSLWSDADNWDSGTVPTAFDIVSFDGITGLNPNKDSIVDALFQGTIDTLIINGYTGTLTLARDLTLKGDFRHNTGSFNASTYTVTFIDASKPSHIYGNTTFYNLTCLTPGKTLIFEANSLTTIQHTLTIEGAEGNYIKLISSIPAQGSEFGIYINAVSDAQGNPYVEYVDVRYSHAYGPVVPILAHNYSIPAELNINWDDDHTWVGLGTDNNWMTAANWSGGVPEANDNLIFSGTTRQSTNNNFAAGTSFVNISITTSGFTLAGNSITVTGSITDSTASGSNTISLAMVFDATRTITVTNSGQTLTASGIISGAGGLTKSGAGTLILSGVNTFTGALNVAQGTLQISASFTVANNITIGTEPSPTGILTIDSGITLTQNAQAAARTLTINSGSSLSGAGTFTAFEFQAVAYNGISITGTGSINVAKFSFYLQGWGAPPLSYTIPSATYGVSTATNVAVLLESGFSNAVTFYLGGNITIKGNLSFAFSNWIASVPNAVIFSPGANNINVGGNFTINSGCLYTKGSETITFNGTANQTFTTNAQAFNNITLNNSGIAGSNDLIVSGALNIDGNLNITDGDLDLATMIRMSP